MYTLLCYRHDVILNFSFVSHFKCDICLTTNMPKLPKYIDSQFYERIDNLRKNKRYQCDTPLQSRTSAYNRFFRHHPDEVPDDRIRPPNFGEMNCTPKLRMWIRWHVIPRRNRIWMQCLLNSKMESLNIIGMIRWIALNKLKAMFTFYLINYNLTMTFNSTPESIIIAQMDKSNSLKC